MVEATNMSTLTTETNSTTEPMEQGTGTSPVHAKPSNSSEPASTTSLSTMTETKEEEKTIKETGKKAETILENASRFFSFNMESLIDDGTYFLTSRFP